VDIYGLTGGIGSGKSTVADLLEEYGIPVVSADELARVVVARGSEGLRDVVAHFGPEVLDEHGELDRRKMAGIVFHDAGRRRELEAILHPRIRERYEQVLDALEKAGHTVVVYEVPLLFEKNLQGDMKAVVLVTADEPRRDPASQEPRAARGNTLRVPALPSTTATQVPGGVFEEPMPWSGGDMTQPGVVAPTESAPDAGPRPSQTDRYPGVPSPERKG
jgi:dephospho-CoA kinase